jgi:hypothetical protein
MSLRCWVLGKLSRGSAPPLDPDELVEVETVPFHMAPMAEMVLREEGIEPTCVETYDIVTRTLSRVQITVPRRELARATQLLATLR